MHIGAVMMQIEKLRGDALNELFDAILTLEIEKNVISFSMIYAQ